MKQAKIILCLAMCCAVAILLSSNQLSAFAATHSQPGSSIPTTDSEIAALTPNMNCIQPPTNIDHATLSTADLLKYGMPLYHTGKNKAHWQAEVRAMKHHVCSGTPINRKSTFASSRQSNQPTVPRSPSCSPYNINLSSQGTVIWTGNIAVNAATDGSCTEGNTYTEADTEYTTPCIKPGSPTGEESSWVGLGGVNNTHLVQTGSESDTYYVVGVQFYNYYAWTEDVAASNSQNWLFSINCGDTMQVYAESSATITHDWTNGDYNSTSTSPSASNATAEWIVERTTYCNIVNSCSVSALPNFQSETFYGLGTTLGNSSYVSPHDIDHVYSNMTGQTSIGSLVYNTKWGPPDYANTITWV